MPKRSASQGTCLVFLYWCAVPCVPKDLIVGYVLDLSTGVLCLVHQKGTERAVDMLDPISSGTLCLVCPNNLQWEKVLGPISSGVVFGHVLGHPFLGCS